MIAGGKIILQLGPGGVVKACLPKEFLGLLHLGEIVSLLFPGGSHGSRRSGDPE
jgi:hypothetical protein